MAKISLLLVFSVVLALPFRSILGQEDDWKNLLGQGGLSQDALDKARMAMGGAAAQAAVNDYFGSALSGGASSDSSDSSPAEDEPYEGEGSSLADFLDSDNTGTNDKGSIADSPVGAPNGLPEDEDDDDDDDDDSSPAGAPEDSFSPAEAPENSPEEESPANSPEEAPSTEAPTNAPVEAPSTEAPTNAPVEAPESAPANAPGFDDLVEGERAPTNAPVGEPDEDDDDDDDDDDDEDEGDSGFSPSIAPTQAPEGEPLDES